MRLLTSSELIDICERGAGRPLFQRALLLLMAAYDNVSQDGLFQLTIGARDVRLFKLRELLFGSRIAALTHCPACNERLEFVCESGDLYPADSRGESLHSQSELRIGNHQLSIRSPNSLDLFSLSTSPSAGDASASREFLLGRCVTSANGSDGTIGECLPSEVAHAAVAKMAEQDPQADVRIALECAACGHAWQSEFDIASFLWTEICARAEQLLREVHSLACAYGWSEGQILAMSCWRRQRYLALVYA
jgi:hypothetical protein